MSRSRPRWPQSLTLSRHRREELRTTLWVIPTLMVISVGILFALTYTLDIQAYSKAIQLPAWVSSGSADAVRESLIAIAAAILTVAGLVFSITILVLQLASQQFGPRMLRNFIRDIGTQVCLGAFVATFVYSILALGSIQTFGNEQFVPRLSATVALALMFVDVGVLLYFIHHVAVSIQLTSVVSGIAADFRRTLSSIRADSPTYVSKPVVPADSGGATLFATDSGFLQAIGHKHLVHIASKSDATIFLSRRPGHFVVEGEALGTVVPKEAAGEVSRDLAKAHIVGSSRTLNQDPGFAVDQLVEVAIRALSSAVNDTFTALNCIDWLGDCLCRTALDPLPAGIYCDDTGTVRLVERVISFERLVKGATDKIRQSGAGTPAIVIRQIENFTKVIRISRSEPDRATLLAHATKVYESGLAAIADPGDRGDIEAAFAECRQASAACR